MCHAEIPSLQHDAGIIISPTDSSTAPAVLDLAKQANIPVVIADIGTDSGEYVSFIISDNYQGAYGVGKALAAAMKAAGKQDGSFDGVPEFVPLLQSGELVVSGMQQPYLMGQESGRAMVDYLAGKTPPKEILVPIKIVTSSNIEQELPTIKETVFANEM